MLIDETSFGTMISDLGTTAAAVFADLFALALVIALIFALCRWGIRGVLNAFEAIESPYDNGS